MRFAIRPALSSDVVALAALNREAYPDLAEEGVVYEPAQLRVQLAAFPEGQIVADDGTQLLGAISTLILPRSIDALAPHTWIGVTDRGTFERHDPTGETLYLADIYCSPAARGAGVGPALYEALFALCRRFGLARVVGGGRLYDFVSAPEGTSPEDYVASVIRGERRDRVLRSQLRAGFQVRGLLPNYLHDWRSRHWATLIVWDNPERARAPAPSIVEPATGGSSSDRAHRDTSSSCTDHNRRP